MTAQSEWRLNWALIGGQDITPTRDICLSGEECRNNSVPGGILIYLFVHAFFHRYIRM